MNEWLKEEVKDMAECPESIGKLEELEKLLPLCRKELLEQAQARLNAGTAKSERDAARQIAQEVGKSEEAVHKQILRERQKQSGTGVPKSEYENRGPDLKEGDELPSEYVELQMVADSFGVALPNISYTRFDEKHRVLWSLPKTVCHLMRIAYASENIPEDIKEWFGSHRRERSKNGMCWLCAVRKRRSKETGLCVRCADAITKDRENLEIQNRGVDAGATKVWKEISESMEQLSTRINAALEKDPLPRIDKEFAAQIIAQGKSVFYPLLDGVQDVAYQDCLT